MDSFNLELPKFLHNKIQELSQREKISVNKFIAYALAEKISTLMTREYVEELVRRVNRHKIEERLQEITQNISEEDLQLESAPTELR